MSCRGLYVIRILFYPKVVLDIGNALAGQFNDVIKGDDDRQSFFNAHSFSITVLHDFQFSINWVDHNNCASQTYAIKSAMAELGPNEVTNRTKIEPLAQQKLAESLNQKYGEGAVFINKVVINNMDFEEAYNTAIQQKSIAQQNADKQKIENEAAIAKAEADKQVAITNAEAEAQKTSIAADAQAEANRKIAESLSDTLIEYQKIQKWDGKLPTVSGSNALVSIDPAE